MDQPPTAPSPAGHAQLAAQAAHRDAKIADWLAHLRPQIAPDLTPWQWERLAATIGITARLFYAEGQLAEIAHLIRPPSAPAAAAAPAAAPPPGPVPNN